MNFSLSISCINLLLKVYEVSINANLSVLGITVGSIVASAFYPSQSDQTNNKLSFTLNGASLQIVQRDFFTLLVSKLMLENGASFYMSGTATAKVHSQVGDLLLTDIPFPATLITLSGTNRIYSFYFN